MSFENNIEHKIQSLLSAVRHADPYNKNLKHFLPVAKRLYLSIITRKTPCNDIYHCKQQMEILIDIIELKLKNQRGFTAVAKQVDFSFKNEAGNHRITLIGHDSGVREMLKSSFISMGYQARMITGRYSILQKVILQKPNILVLDISFPWNDSIELCKNIKLHPVTRYIPLIVVLTYPALKDKIKNHCDAVVINLPLNIQELEARIRMVSLQIQDEH